MPNQKEDKACLLCNKTLRGRSDKKFCDDYCRAAFNNEIKSASNNYIRNVNNALCKNRRILVSLLPESRSTIKTNKEKLLELGFQFKYHTQSLNTKKGVTYFYCYDYGYLALENDHLLIVKRSKQ